MKHTAILTLLAASASSVLAQGVDPTVTERPTVPPASVANPGAGNAANVDASDAGAQRPIIGRVSMDSVGVEIGDASVEIGDEAVLFGRARDGSLEQRVEAVADQLGTLHYELLVRVGQRVRRDFVHGSV